MKERYFVIREMIHEDEKYLCTQGIEKEYIRKYQGIVLGGNIQTVYEIDKSVMEILEVYCVIKDYL